MKNQNKLNAIFIILAALAMGLACSSSNQQAEANKVVDQANKKLEDAKDLYTKTEARNTKLFNVNIQTNLQLQVYKIQMDGEAKEIVKDYEKTSELLKEVSRQYDEVSRMDLSEKYKEYAKLKSDEFAKRSEAVDIRKGNAQAFAEIDDPKTMKKRFDENNSKTDKLFKDAEEIAAKAKKIEDENKDLFKEA